MIINMRDPKYKNYNQWNKKNKHKIADLLSAIRNNKV